MAQFGAPLADVLPAKPNYEFYVSDVIEVPNDKGQYAYNPATDDAKKATKLKWVFVGREGTPSAGFTVTRKTGSYINRDKRCVMLQFCQAIDPTFDVNVAYKSEEDFRAKVINRPVTLALSVVEGQDGGQFNNIDNAYPSDMGALNAAEALKSLGATVITDGEDIPF
jgi:hypothetical protein